ncbi:hypothetical protein M4D55_18280 [Metabacillus idriensis]|uniref:Uncharacterized protein n=1 Tax=Metabacillus idriensis TaxID=324768 RepID=A0A6I2MA13_9BACI|nr:hypothetical protein [Metabacillus idriensis]MCM3597719.1 hypothetical protein [Metabacillus idriensis]MRX54629.1 hypothetical protein [Metabacillus idriensis]
MTILQMKRYFLDEKERETYENTLLKRQPELWERILEMDDEELVERVK